VFASASCQCSRSFLFFILSLHLKLVVYSIL
jgi:hypothetical protein